MNTASTYQKSLQPEEKSLWRYFVEAFTKNYVNFSGRASRREYWGSLLFFMLIQLVLFLVCFGFAFTSTIQSLKPGETNGLLILFQFLMYFTPLLLFALVSTLPCLGLLVRRLHDRGMSGKWVFAQYLLSVLVSTWSAVATSIQQGFERGSTMYFVLLIVSQLPNLLYLGLVVYLFVQTLMDGEPGVNKYGENPKEQFYNEYINSYTTPSEGV